MSLLKAGAVQVGQSGTASQNFHWRNLLDGLLLLSRGSAGSPITDVMRVKADNSVEFPGNVASGVLGAGQTWQNMTASRAPDTTYTNTTGGPIEVIVGFIASSSATMSVIINGLPRVGNSSTGVAGDDFCGFSFIVPNGNTYRVEISTGTLTWLELR